LHAFCESNPRLRDELESNIRPVAILFSSSQFLANFASSHPDALFGALKRIDAPLQKEPLASSFQEHVLDLPMPSGEALLSRVRMFKRKVLLLIALRDLLGKADIVESMSELSILADVIVEGSLAFAQSQMREAYGDPEGDAFSVIAVGKLGSGELNFSSDIDLLYVYGKESGESSGIVTSHGVLKQRISNHEYYCKLGENLNRLLSLNTGDGMVYRVDLRLRPEGQKGSLAMSLAGYEIYYESWGRPWERAVLLRARPIAGEGALGKDFLEMVRPFVYRKYLDFNAIDEIRKMRTKINETFKKDDIKRGYGGIREIEFFVHALQMIYGGKEPILRERSTLKGLHLLVQKNLIGYGDYSALSDNYRFLRTLEHRLQELNDLQTHSLPKADSELTPLSRKMGFPDRDHFAAALEQRRNMVRKIYDSLFHEGSTITTRGSDAAGILLTEDLSDSELRELLATYDIKDRERAMRNIHHIRESALLFQTLRGQRLLNEILPAFFSAALGSRYPDTAINNLQSFVSVLSSEESYLELFVRNNLLIPILIRVFSQSEYLAKGIMKRREYLELFSHEMYSLKSLTLLKKELRDIVATGQSMAEAIRIFKQREEIRLGVLFLDKRIDILRLVKGLTKTAEAIVSLCTDELAEDGLIVVGMGKLGGREITFDSDLDLIFACRDDIQEKEVKAAERLIRLLTSYTKDGLAYRVDVRLRPDGTRGPLISTVDALERYYSRNAHTWEIQALLKARPAAGDPHTARCFAEMRARVLSKRGKEVSATDVKGMRERIERELSREREGYDIKLGPGGLEELEFAVQYLQLANSGDRSELLVQGTVDAIKRLSSSGLVAHDEADFLKESYLFYRTLESVMRLRGEAVLKKSVTAAGDVAEFMGFEKGEEFFTHLEEQRTLVRKRFEKYLCRAHREI
ncbi:MAG TPA: bifunctional [glutamate--ammonia ligase]-adenylyl-L-tyrosine phosphorylase/[glutamate--ammonia-ligase] adenylyltransferase, partial [Thermodesulfovibrionales bacterium]|nr:bifunctional [glutamate--ammonia ligase]-adenylyl-L-tyrosine phosphorylase/[glutamate--ammonia-ligase] adenylyltransferase [Thermodesulfovibrionales bacterium]